MLDYNYRPNGTVEFFDARTGATIAKGKARNGETWHACYNRLTARRPLWSVRRVGGLLHWRIGRLGGSFYWAAR